MKQLSKLVPAHTVTQQFTWVQHNFMLFGVFRGFREKRQMSYDEACKWCRIDFKDGDMMALVGRPHGSNWLLCQDCVAAMKEEVAA